MPCIVYASSEAIAAVILLNSSGVTDKSSISAFSGSPRPDITLSLPKPAAKTEIGTSAMHKATVIRFNFELSTIPPLNLLSYFNNKNNINQLRMQAHHTHYIR